MTTVRIAELKARLSTYLREVRRGRTLTILDGETPIARLVPYAPGGKPLSSRMPSRHYPSLQRVPLPAPLRGRVDVVALLLEERHGER